MKVIGLTGGIGTGKTTVAQLLGGQGAVVVDADRIGHEVLREPEVVAAMAAAFGRDVLDATGAVDRAALARLVFGDRDRLETLNRLTHPRMHAVAAAQIEFFREQGREQSGVLVLDAPLLLEAGWTDLVDEVWVTTAPERTVMVRSGARTGFTEDQVRARIKVQMAAPERLKQATVIIDTECGMADLEKRVAALYLERLA